MGVKGYATICLKGLKLKGRWGGRSLPRLENEVNNNNNKNIYFGIGLFGSPKYGNFI